MRSEFQKKTAMELIAAMDPRISRLLTELGYAAYFLGSEIWVRSERDPEIDMPLQLFRADALT